MLAWGLGLLMLAITALIIGIVGVPGLGPVTNVVFLAAFVFLAIGVVTIGHHQHHFRRHARR